MYHNATHGKNRSALSASFRLILICGALALFPVWGCGGDARQERPETPRPAVTGVSTMVVASALINDYYETSGTVKADRISTVAARIMGTVSSLYVREGDQVKAGQLLLTIDSRDLAQKVRGAAMALESANQNKALADVTGQRYRQLYEEKAISRQEMDQVETRRKVAESEHERAVAAAEEARTYEAFARITAPMAGTVTSRPIEEGSMAVPGQPLMTIENTASLYVEGFVDESLSGRLKRGMSAEIAIGAEKRPVSGTVRDIVPAVDPRTRTFLVKIALPAGPFRSGTSAGIRIPVGRKDAILVPTSAVVARGQLTGVYTVAATGVVTYRLVKTGRAFPDGRMEILSGLYANDRIISQGVQNAVDGGVIRRDGEK